MTVVNETKLPGVGVKHDFRTEDGREIGVLAHKDGRRDIVVYDADDPDSCSMQVTFTEGDSRTLAELLGVSKVNAAVEAVQQEIEGLAIEWLTVETTSPLAGKTIGDGAFRTKTGVSIVAVIRGATPHPAPGPEFGLEAEDVLVAVGTVEGLVLVRELLSP